MNQFIRPCLAFAGLCLLTAAGLGTAGWVVCLRTSRGNCEPALLAAVAAFSGAANVALGVALQEKP